MRQLPFLDSSHAIEHLAFGGNLGALLTMREQCGRTGIIGSCGVSRSKFRNYNANKMRMKCERSGESLDCRSGGCGFESRRPRLEVAAGQGLAATVVFGLARTRAD